MGTGASLEEFDRGRGPGCGLFIGQSAPQSAGKDFGGAAATRFDQSAAIFQRHLPKCGQFLLEQLRTR